jgi:hypothetical protein
MIQDATLTNSYGIKVSNKELQIQIFDDTFATAFESNEKVDIQIGQKHIFCLIYLSVLIGDKVGIHPIGIPLDFPDALMRTSRTMPSKPSLVTNLIEDHKLLMLRENLPEIVQIQLKTNEVITLRNFCNLPNSIIKLDVKDPSHPALNKRQFPLPFKVRPMIDAQVKVWLDSGVIVPAPHGSRYNQRSFPISDKVSQQFTRFVMDPRPINNQIEGDRYFLPSIRHIYEQIGNFEVISELDLKKSFN